MPGPQQFVGLVTAARRMPKTITVTIDRTRVHPVVGKLQRRRTRILTHDPEHQANVGDTVRIINCPPVSAAKRHKLMEIIRRAEVVGGISSGVTASEQVTTFADAAAEAKQQSTESQKAHAETQAPPQSS